MMVIFVSECEKNSIKKTCRILDAFANRVGGRTWKTVITQEGLKAVNKLLKKTASRHTAVTCHWIHRRNHSELLWIVGNRSKFNSQGYIPVNRTEKNIIHSHWENDWNYLPVIKSLAALAALFHDWGKANAHFQEKLKKSNYTDPIRHEWISYMLFYAFVNTGTNNMSDDEWLTRLANDRIDKQKIIDFLLSNTLSNTLPDIAALIGWLIVTHHKLPILPKKEAQDYRTESLQSIHSFCGEISEQWGYKNSETAKLPDIKFPKGILENSPYWLKQIQKWAVKTKGCLPLLKECLSNGSWRIVLHHTRLSLMLGDYFFSSQENSLTWTGGSQLYANTNEDKKPKQKLDEHLIGVMKEALHISHQLPKIESQLPSFNLEDNHILKKASRTEFKWQDKAVDKIQKWKKQMSERKVKNRNGFFAVNMASTGMGKTFANAKIMLALSEEAESLRYILALGLRTLTLQTGDEYRNRVALKENNVAVQIGSKAIMELHEQNISMQTDYSKRLKKNAESGSESLEPLLEEEIYFKGSHWEEIAFKPILKNKKHKDFLYSPVLVCTIDHIMSATETKRGGRYILPCLRLMSSDLVIDEIDDFNQEDLPAIGRLIFLAGMLGRKVMISSATIPPDLAEGYFNTYQKGWLLFCKTRDSSSTAGCAWIDEFGTKLEEISPNSDGSSSPADYRKQHNQFIQKRIKKLQAQPARRKAEIIRCKELYSSQKNKNDNNETKQKQYFKYIENAIIDMHKKHSFLDEKTNTRVSFGLVRMANVDPCIALSQYLLKADFPSTIDIRIMTYHSRQIMLLRSEQEKYLDSILKNRTESLNDLVIREHIEKSDAKNIVFIVVSTPVEEVGRDHDFDWAVVEPSSLRSIIQLAGRVRRHRSGKVESPNVALMQYNLRSIKNVCSQPAYCQPGYESNKFKLDTHNLIELLNEEEVAKKIDAVPRIRKPQTLLKHKKLADLEHKVISHLLTNYDQHGPETLQGYLEQCWYLTALPQVLTPFRKNEPSINLYLIFDDDEYHFVEKNNEGKPVNRDNIYNIKYVNCENTGSDRFWLNRDYKNCLKNLVKRNAELDIKKAGLRYGEINIPLNKMGKKKEYLDQFGLICFNET